MSRATPWPDDWRPAYPRECFLQWAREAYAAARKRPRRTLGRAIERRTGRMFADVWRRMQP